MDSLVLKKIGRYRRSPGIVPGQIHRNGGKGLGRGQNANNEYPDPVTNILIPSIERIHMTSTGTEVASHAVSVIRPDSKPKDYLSE